MQELRRLGIEKSCSNFEFLRHICEMMLKGENDIYLSQQSYVILKGKQRIYGLKNLF